MILAFLAGYAASRIYGCAMRRGADAALRGMMQGINRAMM